MVTVLSAPPAARAHQSAPAAAADRGGDFFTAARSANGFGRSLVRHQNAARRGHGLHRLKASSALRRAARRHARDMVRRHYFGHVSHSGQDVLDRVSRTSYGRGSRFAVQENLYWWSRRRAPAEVVGAWMASAVHRANILNPRFRQVGVATVMRSPYSRRGITIVAVYGSRSGR